MNYYVLIWIKLRTPEVMTSCFVKMEATYQHDHSCLLGCQATTQTNIWPRGYKTFFMLNSAETKIYPAHKC